MERVHYYSDYERYDYSQLCRECKLNCVKLQ